MNTKTNFPSITALNEAPKRLTDSIVIQDLVLSLTIHDLYSANKPLLSETVISNIHTFSLPYISKNK